MTMNGIETAANLKSVKNYPIVIINDVENRSHMVAN